MTFLAHGQFTLGWGAIVGCRRGWGDWLELVALYTVGRVVGGAGCAEVGSNVFGLLGDLVWHSSVIRPH